MCFKVLLKNVMQLECPNYKKRSGQVIYYGNCKLRIIFQSKLCKISKADKSEPVNMSKVNIAMGI